MTQSSSSSSSATRKRCPACKSMVPLAASICEVCGHEFGSTQAIPKAAARRERHGSARADQPARSSLVGIAGISLALLGLVLGAMLFLPRLLGDAPATQPVAMPAVTIVQPQLTPQQAAEPMAVAAAPVELPTPTEPPPPMPLPSPTPIPPIEYTVREGDTCGGIALRYGISVQALAAANQLDPTFCLIRIGQTLRVPVPTPTPGPTATFPPGYTPPPSPTPPPVIVHTVQSGDTCGGIAQRYGVPVALLRAQNNLDEACVIRVGQVLTLTLATPTPVPTLTPVVAQTPTPRSSYPPPILVGPADGAQFGEQQAVVTLQWVTVGLLQPDEWYVVQVQPSGAVTVPIYETKSTSIKLTQDILGDAQEREIAWWVQVRRRAGVDPATGERRYVELSLPSVAHRFTWRRPIATPTP
ncbi:MAG: LysM peptidoglycan-binding domain-containing protein [Thermoflexales bacterium]|nr:LysM peptidoglycan-binding domain-containing protein [Thermoflexales bacterium]